MDDIGNPSDEPRRGERLEVRRITGRESGSHATPPSEIPARGWQDILWRLYVRLTRWLTMFVAVAVASPASTGYLLPSHTVFAGARNSGIASG